MQTLETMKSRSQESINRLVDLGKQQPEQVQTWGITAAAAVAGAVALAATAQGLLAILVTLAAPPVALTVGAIGVGWPAGVSSKAEKLPTPPITRRQWRLRECPLCRAVRLPPCIPKSPANRLTLARYIRGGIIGADLSDFLLS